MMWGCLGLDILAQRISFVVVEIGKCPLGSVQILTSSFQSNNGIVESRFIGTARDGLDFLELLLYAGFDRGHEMLVLNLIERRHVIRQRAFGEKWILGVLHGRILSGDRDSCDLREGERYENAQRDSERIWEKELR